MTGVVVIGDATLDITVVPGEPIRHGADVPAAIRLAPGGQGANVAVRLARRGVPVELVCGLADDPAAGILRAALEGDGVRVVAVPVDATAVVAILVDGDGERSMLSHRAPFAATAATAVDPSAGWLVVSGYLLLEADAPALASALAAHPGRRVLLGCSVPAAVVDAWRAAALALHPDLVVLNRDEAALLGDGLAPGMVITDAEWATAEVVGATATARVPGGGPTTDTTGAGDAFAAALVAALRTGPWPPGAASLEASLAEAVGLASTVARTAGAQGRVPGEREPAARG